MTRCKLCGKRTDSYSMWQPFGPAEVIRTFTAPGWQYRGFPTILICDHCKRVIERNDTFVFRYQGTYYRVQGNDLCETKIVWVENHLGDQIKTVGRV